MKIHFICYIPAQILYLEKVLFLRYGLKMLLAKQITGFLSQIDLWNKVMK